MELKGKVALVTGSAKRVGREIARKLASKGCDIAVHYNSSRDEAEDAVKELKATYKVRAAAFQAEFADLKQVTKLPGAVVKSLGRLDILINSASYYQRVEFGKITETDWNLAFDSNLKAPFFLSQEAGKIMKKQGAGKIVNISDWAALRPYTGYIPYCTAKAGLYYLTHSLAKALSPEVQVNTVMPGPVELPVGVGEKEKKAIEQATLVKRLGSAKDIANAIAFLVESDFIDGAALAVDGGRLIN